MAASRVNDILLFLSVADKGSFAAGAKAFGLSRSAAGKAVARLEKTYGARLINRTTRSLNLTEKGLRLYEHGVTIREALEAADADLKQEPGIPHGVLRIAAPDALGRRLVLPAVYRYLNRWPETQVEMSLSDRVDHLIDQGFDLAIRIGGTSRDSSFISRKIRVEQTILCATPGYLDARGRPERVEQLSRHDLLQFSSQNKRQSWTLREDKDVSVRASGRVRLRLDSAEALRQAVLAGMGIAQLPQVLVDKELAAGTVEHVLPDAVGPEVPIIALYPHRRFLEPHVRHFIDMLTRSMASAQESNGPSTC